MRASKGLVVALALVTAACGGSEAAAPANNTNAGGGGGGGGGGTSGSTSNAISVTDNSFTPSATTVPAGTTITWTWNGSGIHNITFSTAGLTGANDRTTGTFQKTFASAGAFNYSCTNHVGMTGTITVQ